MTNPVLLIIDLLNDFFAEGALLKVREQLVKSVNELTNFARERSIPIVWVRQEFEEDLQDAFLLMRKTGRRITIKGTEGCRFLPELIKKPGEIEIIKKRYSAFYGTNLDEILATIKPSHLILAGINTHACIRATAVDAYQRDFEVILATDCIASYDADFHQESLRYMAQSIGRLMSNEEIFRA